MNTINHKGVMLGKTLIATTVGAVLLAACAAAPIALRALGPDHACRCLLEQAPSQEKRRPLPVGAPPN